MPCIADESSECEQIYGKVRQKPRAIKTKLYPFGVQVAAEKEQNAGEATCWPDVKSQTPNRKIRP